MGFIATNSIMGLKWVNKKKEVVVPISLLKDAIEDGVFHKSKQIALSQLTGIDVKKVVGRPRRKAAPKKKK